MPVTPAGESRIVTGYTYDANNRLTKRSVGEYNTRADTIYTYDANGNLYTTFGRSYTMNPYHKNSLLASVVSDSMGITQYTFNTVNQLVGVQKDGLAATYSYLPDGMRSEKTVNGVTTGHLWDGTNMVAETSDDAVVYKYVRGAGLLYTENATDEKTWYVKDAHGDTVQLTDGNGNIVWNYAYDAFGNQKETVNSGTEPYNPFRYTGEYFDAETGFIYLRARYMDPQNGRFISEDPVCDGTNWYVYAAGNPVMLFDPSGMLAWDMNAGYNLTGDYYNDDNWCKQVDDLNWDWETNWTGPDPFISYENSDPEWAQAIISYYRNDYENAVLNNNAEQTKNAYLKMQAIKECVSNNTVPGVFLDVPAYDQLNTGDLVCWATVAAMITSYYKGDRIDRTKEIAVSLDKNNYNQRRCLGELQGHVDFDFSVFVEQRSFGEVSEYLKQNRPCIARIEWNDKNGHFILFTGAFTVNQEQGILYNDPWGGTIAYLPYEYFCNNSIFTWTDTTTTYYSNRR